MLEEYDAERRAERRRPSKDAAPADPSGPRPAVAMQLEVVADAKAREGVGVESRDRAGGKEIRQKQESAPQIKERGRKKVRAVRGVTTSSEKDTDFARLCAPRFRLIVAASVATPSAAAATRTQSWPQLLERDRELGGESSAAVSRGGASAARPSARARLTTYPPCRPEKARAPPARPAGRPRRRGAAAGSAT